MIYPNHAAWANFLFRKYLNLLFKRNFHKINLIGEIPKVSRDVQIILAPNHSTWWDGFFVYFINDIFWGREFYIMILEEQLLKYKFFTRLGGFSIKHDSPKNILESLNFCNNILSERPYSIITIFPQGELLPSFIRPIQTRRGIDKLLKNNTNIAVLPLAIKIEFIKEEKPEVFFCFGDTIDDSGNINLSQIGNIIESKLNLIEQNILDKQFGITLFNGKKSVSDKSKDFFKALNIRNA